jgi:hypothetical protein
MRVESSRDKFSNSLSSSTNATGSEDGMLIEDASS